MASDSEAKGASAKKRVGMNVQDKKPEAPLKSTASDDGASGEHSGAAFAEGAVVTVRSADNARRTQRATVVRVHRSGELSVKYERSGEVEKYVALSRIQRASSSSNSADEDAAAFEEGDAVLYRLRTDSDDEAARAWRKGIVKTCRRDGAYDVVDSASGDVVKKVAPSAMKRSKAPKTRKDNDSASASDGDASDDKRLLVADAHVEYKDKRTGAWRSARIHRVRSDGTVDVAAKTEDADGDGSDGETIVKRVARSSIRKPSKRPKEVATSKRKDASDDGDSDDTAVRKRRPLSKAAAFTKRSQRDRQASDDSASESDAHAASRRSKAPAARSGAMHMPMRVNQVVEFADKTGRLHRGRVKFVRKDDDACDIEHMSDTDVVSKRVPLDSVRAVSAFARFMGRPAWMQPADPRVFQLNARVLYRTRDGVERKAVVVKVYRDAPKDAGPVYDIEDILDGTVLKRVAGAKLRAVPWLNYSLPTLSGLGLPTTTSLFATIPRKGMRVRFRQRRSGTSAAVWLDGVIVRAKSDATCVIEYVTASGARETAQVPNGDIQTRFISPFGLRNPLRDLLPTLELPRQLIASGSFVEVASGANVYLGTVVSSNEQDRTYVIEYSDGRKEKAVSADRVRLSLRRLRIGTEVEMIVEGPCKEVSKLDGEVAWVHRDERVAVRINGGNNDVFAQVCTHALMVDGQPAFAAPLSSTWLELLGFYLNLALEALVFTWLCFGLIVEMGEMVQLVRDTSSDRLEDAAYMAALYDAQHVNWTTCALTPMTTANGSAPYVLLPAHVVETERAWLVTLLALKAILTVACVGFGARLVHSNVLAIQDNYIDVREYQRDVVRRRHLGRVMGSALVVSYWTLLVYASLLNRFAAFCLLPEPRSATMRFDTLALETNVFATGAGASALETETHNVGLVLALSGKTTLNLFRAVALHVLVFALPVRHTAFGLRLVLLLPACAIAALLCALGAAALHVFYYVQRTDVVVSRHVVTSRDSAWAIVLVLATLWLVASMYSLLAAAGRFVHAQRERRVMVTTAASGDSGNSCDVPDDVLEQAERGEFGLQAKREVLLTKVEQLQAHLGVCKLTLVRVHALGLVHVSVMALAIYANCRLRHHVAQHASAGVGPAMTFHLVACILWLVLSVIASTCAVAMKQTPRVRELWSYVLDV